MKRKGLASLSFLTAMLLTVTGCAGQANQQAEAPMIQSSQVMLPDPDQLPRNEDLSVANDDGSPIMTIIDNTKTATGIIKISMNLATVKDPVKAAENAGQTSSQQTTVTKPNTPVTKPVETPVVETPPPAVETPAGNTAPETTVPSNPAPSTPEKEPEPTTPEPTTPSGGDSGSSGSSGSNTTSDTVSVISGGQQVTGEAYDIVCRVVQNEIGSSFEAESTKALAVATYSYIKYYNEYVGTPPYLTLSNNVSSRVASLVKEVIGQAVRYNGRYCNCTFFAVSSGVTTSAQSVWGTTVYPYLVSVDSSVDTAYSNGWSSYKSTATFSADTLAKKMNAYLGTSLDSATSDPSGWIEILSHTDGKYVGQVRVGDKTTTGRKIRENILGLRSHAFEVEYNASTGNFVFTVYGYGHGVGMSQVGANFYAQQGWGYQQILTHYYTGTSVS